MGGRAVDELLQAFRRDRPDAVVCLGESGQATGITFERVAVNLRDYRLPDNAGRQVVDQPVVAQGPAAYFATLPVRTMFEAVRERGIHAELSMSAGTFLCNEVMYAALHWAATEAPATLAGFVHVPRLPEQVAGRDGALPSMDAMTTARGVAAALTALVSRDPLLGAIHASER